MHIKTIAIAGFKSYREQIFETPFSAKHNVVVGKNGSGKSNFFNAILFVLSEKYSSLRQSERKDLLHATAGSPSLSAYVEITFDNSDGRLVIPGMAEEKEIRIRRTVGIQKDEFRVNDKAISAQDVRQLLESAGFSSANPYYVVEQGRIVRLTNMGDTERLELLKEVAGTKVYEDRRIESMHILEEAKEKREKIDETILKVESRLKEVESERDEWRTFQALEQRRKALEYSLYAKESKKVDLELEDLENSKRDLTTSHDAQLEKTKELQKQMQEAEREVSKASRALTALDEEKLSLETERLKLVKLLAELQLSSKHATNTVSASDSELATLKRELKSTAVSIEKTKKELDAKSKILENHMSHTGKEEGSLIQRESRLFQLQTKRGRQRLFHSKTERDKWLHDEILKTEKLLKEHEKEFKSLLEEEKRLETELSEEMGLVEKQKTSIEKQETIASKTETLALEAIKSRDSFHNERRILFQKIHDAEKKLRAQRDDQERAQHLLNKTFSSHEIRQGLASMQESLNEIGEKKLKSSVHGSVMELFLCDQRFYTAVETTGGNALLSVVVDTFEDGAKILAHMNKHNKPGRVTFLPLDTCRGKKKDLPHTSDVVPLIDQLRFKEKHQVIFAELFGRTALASSLDSAATASKQYNCDAVTLDGDQVNRKGGIQGGYRVTTSRLQAHADLISLKADCERSTSTLHELRQSLATLEKKIASQLHDSEAASEKSETMVEEIRNAHREKRRVYEHITRNQQQLLRTREAIGTTNSSLADVKGKVITFRAELKEDFQSRMGDDDEKELDQLMSQVSEQKKQVSNEKQKTATLSTEVQVLEDTLNSLRKQLDSVQDRSTCLQHTSERTKNHRINSELGSVEVEVRDITNRIVNVENEIADLTKRKQENEKIFQEKNSNELQYTREMQSGGEDFDKYITKKALLGQQFDELKFKLERVGVIPSNLSEYDAMSETTIRTELKKCSEKLRSFTHVNRKALEQYTQLEENFNELVEKRAVTERELTSIREMMLKLDAQKDETIERTVKQVQFQFEKVFLELVTAKGASAELQLLRSKESPGKTGVEGYSGIRIRISFGLGTPVSELAQLSGGQKSLVALSLIFAIQRCDPAPFYLFDEIDAALDEAYRSSVAQMIKRQCEGAQFITATFKQEMLDVADKVYGIVFRNRVSRIQEITHEEGSALLRKAAQERQDSTKEKT